MASRSKRSQPVATKLKNLRAVGVMDSGQITALFDSLPSEAKKVVKALYVKDHKGGKFTRAAATTYASEILNVYAGGSSAPNVIAGVKALQDAVPTWEWTSVESDRGKAKAGKAREQRRHRRAVYQKGAGEQSGLEGAAETPLEEAVAAATEATLAAEDGRGDPTSADAHAESKRGGSPPRMGEGLEPAVVAEPAAVPEVTTAPSRAAAGPTLTPSPPAHPPPSTPPPRVATITSPHATTPFVGPKAGEGVSLEPPLPDLTAPEAAMAVAAAGDASGAAGTEASGADESKGDGGSVGVPTDTTKSEEKVVATAKKEGGDGGEGDGDPNEKEQEEDAPPPDLGPGVSSLVAQFNFPFTIYYPAACERFLGSVYWPSFRIFLREHRPHDLRTSAPLALSDKELYTLANCILDLYGPELDIEELRYGRKASHRVLSNQFQELRMYMLGLLFAPVLNTMARHTHAHIDEMRRIWMARRAVGEGFKLPHAAAAPAAAASDVNRSRSQQHNEGFTLF